MRKGYYTQRHSHLRIRILIGEAAREWHAATSTRASKMRKLEGELLLLVESLSFCTDVLGLPRGVANPGRGCQANAIVRRGLPGKYDCLDG
jgi:hypothetical protein